MYWHVNRGGPQTHNAEWKEALCKIITVYIMIFTQYSRMGKTNGKISEYLLSLVGWSGVDWKKVMGQLSGMILLFSHSGVSKSLQLHGLQHARLPCPSLTPRVFLNSCQLSWWCYLTISSTATPFLFCLQSFPASGSFPLSQLLASGVQSTGASASASVLPMNIQDRSFRKDWFDRLAVQGTLKSLFQHYTSKASILQHSAFFMVQLSH